MDSLPLHLMRPDGLRRTGCRLLRRAAVVMLAVLGSWTVADAQLEQTAIQQPRLAWGDVTGDGVGDLVAGGRVGPFRAETDPVSARRAQVVVYPGGDAGFGRPTGYDGLNVVDDVCTADVDGDGIDEVVVLGAGRLTLLRASGGFRVTATFLLGGDRSLRVTAGDVDSDGRDEVLVSVYEIDDAAEAGRTDIVVIGWDNGLEETGRWSVDGHMGDLVIVTGGAAARVLMEVGAGDEGGLLVEYTTDGRSTHRSGELVLPTRVRLAALSSTPGGALAAFVDGTVYRLRGGDFRPESMPLTTVPPGVSDALVLPETTPVLLIGGRAGVHLAEAWF